MSGRKPPHEHHSDTQELQVVRPLEEGVHERTEFELVGNHRLPIKVDFQHSIELRLGRGEQTPPCYLIRYPSHLEHEATFAVVQPDIVRRSPGRGWGTVGGRRGDNLLRLGRTVSPQFEFGPDVSRHHCLVTTERAEIDGLLEIETYGRNGVRVLMHPDDLAGEIETFNPEDN